MESRGAAVGDGVWRKSFRECCRCGGMPSYLSQWRGRRLRGFGSITKMSFVLWNLTSIRNFHQQFLKKMQPISGWPIEKCHVLNTQLIKYRSIFWSSPIFWRIAKLWFAPSWPKRWAISFPFETTLGTLEFLSHICFTLDFHLRCLPGQVCLR